MRGWLWVGLAVMAAGCSKGGFSKRGTDAETGVLRYAMVQNPTTFDPAVVQDTDTIDLLQNLYEGLVAYDEKNQIVPRLASGWTLEEDGRTYVFRLREATFHNGDRVTAEDVRWSLERSLSKPIGSPTATNYLSDIIGAPEFAEGRADRVRGLQVDGDTLKITIDKPRPYFLGKLTYPCAFVLSKASTGEGEIRGAEGAVGTGPFRIGSYSSEQSIVLEAFGDYHGGSPHLQRISRPILKDPATRLTKFRNGELDFLSIPRQDLIAVRADPELSQQLRFSPRPSVFYIGANPRVYPPFQDRRVRRAMAMAIDKRKLAEEILGEVPPADSLVPPGVPGHREKVAGLQFDPEEARRELAAAGYPGGKGLPPLTITIRDQAVDYRLAAEAILGDLRKHLNWPVNIRTLEFRSLLEARNAKKIACYHGSWVADYLDPQNFLSMILSGDTPLNFDSYRNPEFDRLCAQADVESDEARRRDLYARAEDIALQDAARIPLYYGRDAMLVGPRVTELRENLFGQLPHHVTRVK